MIRIVKMTFDPSKVDKFLVNFNENKKHIRNFDGVEHLELLNDRHQTNIYFTYSVWTSEEALENYRNSALFKSIWSKTKPLFIKDAEAWSVDCFDKVEKL